MHINKWEYFVVFIIMGAIFMVKVNKKQHPKAMELTSPKCTLGAKSWTENRGAEPH